MAGCARFAALGGEAAARSIAILFLGDDMRVTRYRRMSLVTFLLTALAGLAAGEVLQGATFVVAPRGKDTNPGTVQQPLTTLEAARDAARKAPSGPHRILVMPGDYLFTKPLELDSRDNDLTIEAVNRFECPYLWTADETLEFVNRFGSDRVTVHLDTFHMNIEDASVHDSLVEAGALVGYVHLADSNRWAPGQGHTDFPAILDALRAVGYDDWVAVEILPFPSADEAASQAITYLRTLLPRASA